VTARELTKKELVSLLTELRTRVADLERLETVRAEEIKELQKRSSMLRSLLHCSPEPMVVYDAEGRVLFLNDAFTATFGWSNEELLGQRIDYVPEDCVAQAKETLEKRFKGEDVPPFDSKRLTKDGRILDVHISSALFTYGLGQPAGHIVTLRDITERKRMEQALRESEAKYRLLAEEANDILWTTDLNMRTMFVSPSIERVLGFTPEERLQQDVGSQLTAESLRLAGAKLLEELHIDSDPEADPDRFLVLELDYRHKTGSVVCLESVMKFIRDETGRPIGIHGVSRDVTDRKKVEKALRESGEFNRRLVEHAPFGIAYLTRDGIVEYLNPAVNRIMGLPEGQMSAALGWNILELPGLHDRSRAEEKLRRILEGGSVSDFEAEYKSTAGRDTVLLVGGTPRFGSDGTVQGAILMFTDIGERKRAEEALRESEEKYRCLVEKAPIGILSIDREGRILEVNQKLLDVLGSPSAEATKSINMLTFPLLVEAGLSEAFRRCLETGEEVDFETPYTSKWGKTSYLRTIVTPSRDLGGTVRGYQAVAEDITERKRAEEALRKSEERLELALKGSDLAMWDYNLQTGEAFFNDRCAEMVGYTLDETEPQFTWWGKQVHPEDIDRVNEAFNAHVESRSPLYECEHRFRHKSGEYIWILARAKIVERDEHGNPVRIVGTSLDITERKQEEQEREALRNQLFQAQKMEAIGTLTGGIAHDFNNLLQVILGYSELLLAKKDQNHREYADLQKIFRTAKNGADLVQRLLMFSRKTEPKPISTNLNGLVLQVEKLLRRTIPRMIDIQLELSADLPEIDADPSQIEQVLMNLAVNARDAMPDGGKLTVKTSVATLDEDYCRVHVEANPGEYVLLEVLDTGHGMDKETVEHIFEPFFTTKEMGRGTGLGLAMVYGIVRQHKGHITVYSEVDKGTAFRVYLPAIPTEEGPAVEDSGITPAFGTETVLLVDDDEFVRELGAQMLTEQGYTVLLAEDGRDALDLFEEKHPQIALVILDLIMPEMGGTECLKELLKIDPKVRILVASGYSTDASIKDSIDMGAKGFLTKPFGARELLRAVRKVLDES
jgi:PAS domain S-box-containing protein